ncbi:hypothetical protein ASPFODRAFT_47525 [Aspergillus luchuensis CBS 106.47]|uniref:Uncharacterized protein n=1 Tax=Aspergillus luchuensis (strain CBS 106.47) TaxID=1137211 RepID=A0A1M3TDX3_ASPLC|nr:hypothetical protein ASPFODRAFT_47525 [Aspergillus luchuensis CBS 106.47]
MRFHYQHSIINTLFFPCIFASSTCGHNYILNPEIFWSYYASTINNLSLIRMSHASLALPLVEAILNQKDMALINILVR